MHRKSPNVCCEHSPGNKKSRPEGRLFCQVIYDYLEAAGAEAAGAGVEAAGAEAGAEPAGAAAGAAASEAAGAAGAGAGAGAAAGAGVEAAGAGASAGLLQAAKATANREAINNVFFMNFPSNIIKKVFAMNNYR